MGDNVVTQLRAHAVVRRARRCCSHLEHLHVASDRNFVDVRFPVQYVIRPQSKEVLDYRGYAGTVASGVLKPGRPRAWRCPAASSRRSRRSRRPTGAVDEAYPPMAVTITLTDDIDYQPRRHAVPAAQRPARSPRTSTPRCAGWTRPRRSPRAQVHDQAHDPLGAGAGQASRLPDRRQHAPPRRDGDRALAQRDRADPAARDPAAVRRPVLSRTARPARSSSSTRPATRPSPPA